MKVRCPAVIGIWIDVPVRRCKGRNNIRVKCPLYCKYREKCVYGKKIRYSFRINVWDMYSSGLLRFETS